jgi:two-component system nitrogen regulation response regulator GlnG
MLVNPADYKEGIVGSSEPMQEVLKSIGQVAASDATVLITGESGTGKELVARCIHQHSLRAKGPFLAVNCAAIPENLIESELFGHEKGAFTGATNQKPGKFELCDGGTIFLDEIGDMSLPTQTKVLRAIQEGEIQRVGGTTTLKVSVRLVAATNKDLEAMVATRQFREDLYYRLNVFRIRLPALRHRKGDVPLLVDYMLQRQAAAKKLKPKRLSDEALDALLAYDWPGNVRELENVVQRANVLAKGETILPKDLPQDVLNPRKPAAPAPVANAVAGPAAAAAPAPIEASLGVGSAYDSIYKQGRAGDGKSILTVIEMEMIKRAMEETRGNQLRSAMILGINRSTLKKRLLEMREAGIKVFT